METKDDWKRELTAGAIMRRALSVMNDNRLEAALIAVAFFIIAEVLPRLFLGHEVREGSGSDAVRSSGYSLLFLVTFGTVIETRVIMLTARSVSAVREGAYYSVWICAPAAVLGTVFFVLLELCALILLVVPAVYFGVLFCFFLQCIVLYRSGPVDMLKQSAALVRGRWWNVFLYMIAFNLPSLLLGLVSGFIVPSSASLSIVQALIQLAEQAAFFFAIVAQTIFFLNLVSVTDAPGDEGPYKITSI